MVDLSVTNPAGAFIYYTLDGSAPSTDSTLYSGPFMLSSSATVKAMGVLSGYNNSVASSAIFTINIPGANQAPVLNAIGNRSIDEGQTLSFTVTANDPDLTTPILSADLSGLPIGATFNSDTGVFNWTSLSGEAGSYTAIFTATDSVDSALSSSETVSISVNLPRNTTPYRQDGGSQALVSVEAENYHFKQLGSEGHDWQEINSYGGHSGSGAMQPLPEDRVNYSIDYDLLSPRLDYNIEFVTTGTHYVWVRGLGPNTGSDSVHVGLDGQAVASAATIAGFNTGWRWSNTQQSTKAVIVIQVANVGVHTLNLWMRESGMVIDKLVLTTDPSYVPNSTGPIESLLSGAPVVSAPTINPNGGTFTSSVMVDLSVTNPAGAFIYYTLDGSAPSTDSTLYSGPFMLSSSATVKAMGIASGYNESGVTVANFIKINSGNASDFYKHYWELNEIAAGTYYDVVSDNTANCTNCPTATTGQINGGQYFNGVDEKLNISDDGSYNWHANSRFSIEVWIKTGSCNGADSVIGRQDGVSSMKWWLGCNNGSAEFELVDRSGNGTTVSGNSNIDDDNWHHLVGIRDGFSNTNLLYVDGVLEMSTVASYSDTFNSDADINIGWMNDSVVDYHFNGLLDEIAIAERVLTETEILRHYQDGVVGLAKGYLGSVDSIKLLPLGDSITNRVGYRPELYFDLINYGYNMDFVGTGTDGSGTHDRNHEGHSGYTPADIASSLAGWLNINSPEVITLHIGTNGLDVAGVEDIMNIVDMHDPGIPVVLARIINRSTFHQATTDFNIALEAMAQTRINNGDRIVIVDHESALNYSTDMLDDKHPNTSGYRKMKDIWLSGLQQILTSNLDTAPTIVSVANETGSIDTAYDYTVKAEGYPLISYKLTSAPAGMVIHPDTGNISWSPAATGSYNVSVEAQNRIGFTEQSFMITVD